MRSKNPSTVLDQKPEAAILSPTARPFYLTADRKYDIYPMPDGTLMNITSDLDQVVALVQSVLNDMANRGMLHFSDLGPSDLIPLLPAIIRFLIPNATRIIAACLRVEEQFVSDNFSIAKKLEALRLIVEAEDLPLILKNWVALMAAFQPAAPETPEG